jgi:hypothetical protein
LSTLVTLHALRQDFQIVRFAGFKAGFSHAPNMDGKERYVFFSFPHIAIDSEGKLGAISRPGRAGASSACGALIAALGQFQNDPATMTAYAEGAHDPSDPEFAILKQRLAATIEKEGLSPKKMDIVDMTKLAERAITSDLEYLIGETVDTDAADYAVITGVHVHNWGNEGTGAPTLEWIAPAQMYVVNGGKRTTINLEVCARLVQPVDSLGCECRVQLFACFAHCYPRHSWK